MGSTICVEKIDLISSWEAIGIKEWGELNNNKG